MTGPAMQKALDQITDEFRIERKERKATMLNGHRVKAFVADGRYTFPEACRLMKVDGVAINNALNWLIWDGAMLNDRYDTNLHSPERSDYSIAAWFDDQEQQQPSATVIDLMTAINTASALQAAHWEGK